MEQGAQRTAACVAACALWLGWAGAARAEVVSVEPGAAVDIVDLPPLEELGDSAPDSAALLAAVAAGEDLVTGAAKREQSLGNVASAVTVISGDRLRRMGARTVGEAIATAAGLHLVDDRLSTRVNIRGIQPLGDFNTRILVIIDGTSVTENWSHLSGVGYDVAVSIDEVERIEVIRGPVSSIYGTNAFFGIINIITRGPSVDGRAWGRMTGATIGGLSAAAGFAVGTVDRQLRGEISANRRLGERVCYRFSGNPADPCKSLERDADDGAQIQASISGAYRGTFAQLRGYVYDRTIPFGVYNAKETTPYTQSNRQVLADVGHVIERGPLQLSGRLFGGLYRFSDRATDEGSNSVLVTIGTARTIGAEARGRYQVHKELLGLTAGIEATYNDTTSDYRADPGELQDGGDLEFGAIGLYVEADSSPLPWLSLTAGVRVDGHGTFETGVSPRLAAFFSRGDRYGLKLLYAEGFRYPSTYESEFHDGADFIKNFNGALSPERINSKEAVLWARPTPATWLRASVFDWIASEIIQQGEAVPGEEPHNMIPPGALWFANSTEYRTSGLELEASYRNQNGWLAFGGAALTRVRDGRDMFAGAPWGTASIGVSSPLLASLFHVSSELTAISGRYLRPIEEGDAADEAAPFFGWNLALYAPSFRGFDITVGVRNLIGKTEEVPAADDFERIVRAADVVPGEGRELYVRVGHALH